MKPTPRRDSSRRRARQKVGQNCFTLKTIIFGRVVYQIDALQHVGVNTYKFTPPRSLLPVRPVKGRAWFWNSLKEIANSQNISVHDLVSKIDKKRQGGSLSSATGLFILDYYRRRV